MPYDEYGPLDWHNHPAPVLDEKVKWQELRAENKRLRLWFKDLCHERAEAYAERDEARRQLERVRGNYAEYEAHLRAVYEARAEARQWAGVMYRRALAAELGCRSAEWMMHKWIDACQTTIKERDFWKHIAEGKP